MPKVTFVSSEGERTTIEGNSGDSLMQVALVNNVSGILAECGGSASCATCHVYVDHGFLDRLPPKEDLEDDMLEFAASPRQPNSRLSCQLVLDASTDGIVVTLPPAKGSAKFKKKF